MSQFKVNYIVSCLLFCNIRTTKDLIENFDYLITQINKNPQIFEDSLSSYKCFKLLKKAIACYNDANAYVIRLDDRYEAVLDLARNLQTSDESFPIECDDDLSIVTRGWDAFADTFKAKEAMNKDIQSVLNTTKFAVCPHVIIGAGDTGTTVWLEKYKKYHNTANQHLKNGELPPVLMIGDGSGSWKHDYTLAQPLSILERANVVANPSDYMSLQYYQSNPYANGRHIYQANQVILDQTKAPLLNASVLHVEKRVNHAADWQVKECDYRLIVNTQHGEKAIYTDEINFCTGLGAPRNSLDQTTITKSEFETLNKFDPQKKFTPIVDGNQFILTDSEEQAKGSRIIVIYGGGGTAAACYRKGFFGHDIRTENLPFEEKDQKNTVVWVAKQFNKAGTGKLVTNAIKYAKARDELAFGELVKIQTLSEGKLLLTFKKINGDISSSNTFNLVCDQLIYSIGQDDVRMKAICEEVLPDLKLEFDSEGMVLNLSSSDKKMIFFGAAAMALQEQKYMDATWTWLKKENIGGDVGPGSMPPSRSQIKRYNALHGIKPENINANMDTSTLIQEFLISAGVEKQAAKHFVAELVEARTVSTAGCSYSKLEQLLKAHKLNELISIDGHGHLIKKSNSVEPAAPAKAKNKFAWFNGKKQTSDASTIPSSVAANVSEEEEKSSQELLPIISSL